MHQSTVFLLFSVVGGTVAFDAWPNPSTTNKVSKTITVKASEPYDGQNQRFISDGLGDGDQSEDQEALFELEAGATIKNVIIGSPAGDGIHCKGSCTIENVWWEDVGEDAATFRGDSSSNKYSVTGGGAKSASDKVFQHNGAGTLTIQNFQADSIGKLYRSCGNCKNNGFDRHVVINNVKLSGTTKVIAGVNGNYGDTATLSNIIIDGTVKVVCQNFKGTSDNDEEPSSVAKYTTSQDGDGKVCIYKKSDLSS